MPRNTDRRAEVVAFGRVVVDDVEDHFDPGAVHGPHHRLELLHLGAAGGVGIGVFVVGREEPDRVVAPVVAQTLLLQGGVLDVLVHRHQLDRGDAERGQHVDDGRMVETRVGAAVGLGDLWMQFRQSTNVRLVDDRLVVGMPRWPILLPVEERADHDRGHRVAEGVRVVTDVGGAEVVGVQRLVEVHRPVDRLGIGVEQEL